MYLSTYTLDLILAQLVKFFLILASVMTAGFYI